MFKGAASKIELIAYDSATGAPKTGDAANLTAYLKKDHGTLTALTDTSATEDSSTNAPGTYTFDVSAAEATADDLYFSGKSATSGVYVVPVRITTIDPALYGIVARGTAQGATSTTLQLATGEVFADNTLIGATAWAYGSTQGYWQQRTVTANTGSTDTLTVDAWAVTPSGTITYLVFGTAPIANTGVTVNAASIRTAIGIASANLDTQLTGISAQASNLLERTPAALISGRMDSTVGAYQAGQQALKATVETRTLDVSATGEAGIDWANVGSPSATVSLSATSIKTATDVETDTQDLQGRTPAALGANGNMKADLRDILGQAQGGTGAVGDNYRPVGTPVS